MTQWILVSIAPGATLGKDETLEGRFDNYQQAHDAMSQFLKANPTTPCYCKSMGHED